VGDTRQYGAVEAGKPFADLQAQGLATAELTDNVRAQSGIMKTLAPLLDQGELHKAMGCSIPIRMRCHRAIWRPMRSPSGPACRVRSASRPCSHRRAGLARRGQHAGASGLKARGEIGQQGVTIPILDRVN
jgi:hypothetical protein